MGDKKTFCSAVCPWAIRQSKQISTWRGLALLGASLGVFSSPEQAHAIISAVASIFGVIEVVKNEAQ